MLPAVMPRAPSTSMHTQGLPGSMRGLSVLRAARVAARRGRLRGRLPARRARNVEAPRRRH